jgi:hypothetical protein
LPPLHVNPHSAPAAQVHWAPSQLPVQVLPGAQYTGQLPAVHSRAQVQPAGQVQSPPFWQVSSQHLPAPHPVQVESHEPPNPPIPVEAELLAPPAPPIPVVVEPALELDAPPALDVVSITPPAPDEADSDADPPADVPAPARPWPSSGSVQLDAASCATSREAAASAKARARRRRDIGAG